MDIKELLLDLKVNSSQVEYGYAFDDWKLLDDAANMISQQADRIAELEKRCLDLCFSEAYANQSTKVTEDLLLDRIAELEKDGKVCATCGGLVYDSVLPQIKELSDEEIEELQAEHTEKGHFADTLNVKDFARAILKKASEK
jgi:hypothetical protein